MKSVLKMTTAAAALAGSALFCAPAASAAYVGIGVGPVGFDVYSGGYCDRWGCPNDYWSYPIFYGPVYYDNVWYRGPVYYRTVGGERWYWIHGAWHRDQWRGARPSWAREYRYGPPLGLDYYRSHGFRVRDEDWRAWRDRDERYRAGYHDNDRGGYYGNEDREQYGDRERYNERDMERDNGYDREYDRDRGTYEHSGDQSGYDRDRYNDRDENGPDYDRDRGYDNDRGGKMGDERGYDHSGYDRDHGMNHSGYEHSSYDRERDRGMVEHSNYDHSGGASGSGHMTHGSSHTTHHSSHHHSTSSPSGHDSDHGYQHTGYDRDMNRSEQDHMRSDMDRPRSDDQRRDHGKSSPDDRNPDQDRSENQNGYQHTTYERPGSPGHAKGLPPSKAHSQKSGTKPNSNPDDESSGPSD